MKLCSPLAIFLLSCSLLVSGCSINSTSKAERHQAELTLHKVRTEVDEIKHDLNTYEIEHHMLEGKLIDQEQTIANLKQQISELKQGPLEAFDSALHSIDEKIAFLKAKQGKILSDIRQLSDHANGTTTALSQYKERIAYFEKAIGQLRDIIKIKEGLEKLSSKGSLARTYVVQLGDSLDKIAREQGASVEEIKQLNQLSSDLIVVDQELLLP